MAAEEQVIETPAEDGEYTKPNPQDNPRNHVLAEIAKSVADKRTVESAEKFDSIDDDGNVTPALTQAVAEVPAVEAEAPAAVEETVVEATAPAPAAAPALADPSQAIDPTARYKVKVDGVEVEIPGQKIIDAGIRTFQKETAADFRLNQATQVLAEARASVTKPQPEQTPQPAEMSDADLAYALQFGTPEQATEAAKALRNRGTVSQEQVQSAAQQARTAVRDELQFNEALNFVKSEYGDLFANDHLKRHFFNEESRHRASGDKRPYKDLYQAIGDDLRKALNMPKPGAATQTGTTPSRTAAERQSVKASTPTPPRTAASRLAASEAPKIKSPSEVIAEMAASRGKNRLGQPMRKG